MRTGRRVSTALAMVGIVIRALKRRAFGLKFTVTRSALSIAFTIGIALAVV